MDIVDIVDKKERGACVLKTGIYTYIGSHPKTLRICSPEELGAFPAILNLQLFNVQTYSKIAKFQQQRFQKIPFARHGLKS